MGNIDGNMGSTMGNVGCNMSGDMGSHVGCNVGGIMMGVSSGGHCRGAMSGCSGGGGSMGGMGELQEEQLGSCKNNTSSFHIRQKEAKLRSDSQGRLDPPESRPVADAEVEIVQVTTQRERDARGYSSALRLDDEDETNASTGQALASVGVNISVGDSRNGESKEYADEQSVNDGRGASEDAHLQIPSQSSQSGSKRSAEPTICSQSIDPPSKLKRLAEPS